MRFILIALILTALGIYLFKRIREEYQKKVAKDAEIAELKAAEEELQSSHLGHKVMDVKEELVESDTALRTREESLKETSE